MHTLTYWMAEHLTDSSAYNIRAKRKRDVVCAVDVGGMSEHYGPPRKVFVEYVDTFDLMLACMTEARGYWEC